jgi:hypothetical protein
MWSFLAHYQSKWQPINPITWSFHSWKLFHDSNNIYHTSCQPFLMPFMWCNIVFAVKSINDWTFDFTCFVDIRNLCVNLLSCDRNQQPCLLLDLYNIYVDLDTPTILYQAVSQISTPCTIRNMSPHVSLYVAFLEYLIYRFFIP